ncbi:MAG TPA: ribosome-associated translation inhibitor RaiA, partial [Candidatus Angelobacter sp.]
MNVEYTGRQYEITPITRKQVEGGLEKIQKILGTFETHVILSTEKRRHIAEITITVRNHAPIVGLSEAQEMNTAIGGALDKIERQAVKYKTRWKSKKRQARKKMELAGESQQEPTIAIAV